MRHCLIFCVLIGTLSAGSRNVYAQDPTFSQAFLSPVYLNPAATGTGEYDMRVSMIHRRQWMTIPSAFNYSAVSADLYLPRISSGVGVLATHASEGFLRRTGLYLNYAYTVCAGTLSPAENGGTPKWFWTGGFQFGVQSRRLDYSKLVFADELDIYGVIPNGVSQADLAIRNGRFFPDFAAGSFFSYNPSGNKRLLIGVSAHHINRPDESLIQTSDTFRSQLPVRWSGNIMYTHTNLDSRWSYTFSVLGFQQASHRNYQAGLEVTQNEYNISVGAWYRTSGVFTDMQTIGLSVSFNLAGRDNNRNKLKIGVAHDASLGSNSYSYTTGSTEAALVWDHSSYSSDASNPCKPVISSQTACPANR